MPRSSRLPFLIALIAIAGILSSGCTLPGMTPSGGGGGVTDITVYKEGYSSLDEAMASFHRVEQEQFPDLAGMEITQVMGVRVSSEGKARTWTLGFRGLNSTKVLEYHAGDWTRLDLDLPLPDQAIRLDQVLSPDRLYATQKARIKEVLDRQGTTESDLLLAGDVYTLTVPSTSGTSVLRFDARTGAVK
ncbi:MAG: hypothetical protein LUQ64_03950 [Methanomicrobiales archaeon]|nr:hypothetical protein [Methanomicrobiales archaeon]